MTEKLSMLQLPTIDLRQWAPEISFNNQKPHFRIFSWLAKAGLCFILSGFLILCQAQIFNAFEAHIINVTARICKYSETRTIGYWKTHPNVYAYYLPQYLGPEPIISIDDADEIFKKANAREMADMLRAQLLGMKFNIAHFDIGGYFVESAGMTLNEIAAAADQLLISDGTRKELEDMKDLLDELNNLHQIKYCGPSDFEPEPEPEPDPEPDYQCLKINEVYYNPDTNHGSSNDEWLELYNVCLRKINLQNWTLKDNSPSQETISQDLILESEQFAVLFAATSTLTYWPGIPDNTLKISLGGTKLFNGLSNTGDHIVLNTPDGLEADAVSWGTDTTAFDPSAANVAKGHSIARIIKGQDTDTAADWQDLSLPNPGTNPHNNSSSPETELAADMTDINTAAPTSSNEPENLEDLELKTMSDESMTNFEEAAEDTLSETSQDLPDNLENSDNHEGEIEAPNETTEVLEPEVNREESEIKVELEQDPEVPIDEMTIEETKKIIKDDPTSHDKPTTENIESNELETHFSQTNEYEVSEFARPEQTPLPPLPTENVNLDEAPSPLIADNQFSEPANIKPETNSFQEEISEDEGLEKFE